nr:hypothetical protein [Enterococcus faecium]
MIVKNGKKKSLIQLNKCANQLTYLFYHSLICFSYTVDNILRLIFLA